MLYSNCIAGHFATWGALYQVFVTLVLGGITIWVMFKQLQNKKMMTQLQQQTKSINNQLLLIADINVPCLMIYYSSGDHPAGKWLFTSSPGKLQNIGSSIHDLVLQHREGDTTKLICADMQVKSMLKKHDIINLIFEPLLPKSMNIASLRFKDSFGNRYYQTIKKNGDTGEPTITGPVPFDDNLISDE